MRSKMLDRKQITRVCGMRKKLALICLIAGVLLLAVIGGIIYYDTHPEISYNCKKDEECELVYADHCCGCSLVAVNKIGKIIYELGKLFPCRYVCKCYMQENPSMFEAKCIQGKCIKVLKKSET